MTHVWIHQDYPGSPPVWYDNPYSAFSYNSAAQRTIIDNAVTAGANIKIVFTGHAHTNAYSTVNGIVYARIDDMILDGFAIANFEDNGTFTIDGYKQENYNRTGFFISPGGNDDNPGTSRELPWATIAKAISDGYLDDATVQFMPGVFREYNISGLTGTTGHPVTWNFESGSYVSAADIITGFTLVSGEHQAACTSDPYLVIKNGIVLTEGTVGSLVTGEWGWSGSVLYLKDDPTGTTIEANQRYTGIGFTTGDYYLTVNGLKVYGASRGLYIDGTPNNLTFNDTEVFNCQTGAVISDTGTNVIPLINLYAHNNSISGVQIFNSSQALLVGLRVYDNINANGIRVDATAHPTIAQGTFKGNKNDFRLANTGTPGPTITNCISTENSYRVIYSTGVGASEIKNSYLDGSFTWGVTTNTDNTLTDPLITSSGRLQKASPCIGAAEWDTYNQSGSYPDPDGRYIYKKPDVGAYQGVGLSSSKTINTTHFGGM
ncbi:MAG: right-handed parallel beta-helix repeat-containing protein [PVC group bacterium]|nr:right-handed parallel beta-helix repeat-containing protein [PVC group bacterium]